MAREEYQSEAGIRMCLDLLQRVDLKIPVWAVSSGCCGLGLIGELSGQATFPLLPYLLLFCRGQKVHVIRRPVTFIPSLVQAAFHCPEERGNPQGRLFTSSK